MMPGEFILCTCNSTAQNETPAGQRMPISPPAEVEANNHTQSFNAIVYIGAPRGPAGHRVGHTLPVEEEDCGT